MDKTDALVLRETDERGVVRLTLNRPHAFNSLSEDMLAALQIELDAIAQDESARVVVLAAAGKAFCAGHDLKEMRAEPSLDYYQKLFAQCSRVMLAMARSRSTSFRSARMRGSYFSANSSKRGLYFTSPASSGRRIRGQGAPIGRKSSRFTVTYAS